jgi:hypothetical protein
MEFVYILQFKSGGEMEDIAIYLDREKAINCLKTKWETRSILAYKLEDEVASELMYVYTCDETGKITQFKI